ncbi:MAG: ABC transporter transmembrane domain-containing protein [Halanaerobiaceae bacterium]
MNVSSINDEMAKERLKKIPDEIIEKTQQIFDSDEEPMIVAQSDLNLKGYYEDNWLIVTEKKLYIFHFIHESSNKQEKDLTEEEKPERKIEYQTIDLNKIESASIKRYVGNAFLQVQIDGKTRNLLRFSLSLVQRFEWVSQKIEKMIGIRDEDLEDDIKEADLEDMTKERLEYEDRCPVCGRKLPPGMDVCPKCIDKEKLFKRMFKYLKPYWKQAIFGLIMLWTVTALNLAPPYITRTMIDNVFPNQANPEGNYDLFILMVGILAGIYLFRALFVGVRTYVIQWIGQKVTMDLRSKVYAHIQQLSIDYYTSNRTGKIMNRVTTDTARLKNFLVEGLQQTLQHIFVIIGIIIILFSLDWQLALMSLFPIPLIIGMTVVFANKIHLIYHRIWRRIGDMKAILGDTIPGIKVVKAFTKENEEINKFDLQLGEVFSEQMEATKARSIFRPAMVFSTSIGAIIIWGYGGYNVLEGTGRLTLGTLVAFISYMWRFYNPIRALARLSDRFESAITSAERIFNIMDIEPETDEYNHSNITMEEEELQGEVEFENVSFKYEGEDEEVLTSINVKVEAGETVGLVGPTGAGKTTFVNLIPRFYDINNGKIKLDGNDLRDYELKWLRRQIGIVPQHPFLFYGTIAQNIAYGIENATRAEIIRAAKMANAHDFIMDFPMGYDTHVGERGVGLSGGERQRVSIARAILKNAKIMILDEATSSVDTETEAKIQGAIDRLIEGRTTFVIAHRLSTLKNADKLIVIEDGEIVEVGSHEELLNKEEGLFKKLWDMQTTVKKLEM